jgi:endoglycosylceramidase
MGTRLAAFATGLLVVAAAATPASAVGGSRVAGELALAGVHAVRGLHARIEDARGREVLLRGVNVNQLGDYYQANPAFSPTVALTREDFSAMQGLGFDVVRLIVSWSALEPTPGSFDDAYVARIRSAVSWARAAGIYVVLDMHQDAWGKYIATPPSESCLPSFTPAVGFDGAPRWATITDGLPTCKQGIREIAPAVAEAFSNFYLDRAGIQGNLVRTWARLARAFAADPAIAGYDLLNEPNPGFLVGGGESVQLGLYYARAIAAIRSAESGNANGFHHVVFFEPGVLWSALATDTPPPADLDDPNVVFAPHLYAGSLTIDGATVEQGFSLAATSAAAYGTTIWSGEWGWFGDPIGDSQSVLRYAAQEDAHRWGGAWWDWKQACGDPHMIGAPGGRPGSVSPSLNRFACPSERSLGRPAQFVSVLSRAYPRAAPGRLTEVRSDPASGAWSVAGRRDSGSCEAVVWAPRAPVVSAVGARGVRVVSQVGGGYIVRACVTGNWRLSGTPR